MPLSRLDVTVAWGGFTGGQFHVAAITFTEKQSIQNMLRFLFATVSDLGTLSKKTLEGPLKIS
jgi:hypothetical protein